MITSNCQGKSGTEHRYRLDVPKWARGWSKSDKICQPWVLAHNRRSWYCRHVLICISCGVSMDLPAGDCPSRPEDDGSIEF